MAQWQHAGFICNRVPVQIRDQSFFSCCIFLQLDIKYIFYSILCDAKLELIFLTQWIKIGAKALVEKYLVLYYFITWNFSCVEQNIFTWTWEKKNVEKLCFILRGSSCSASSCSADFSAVRFLKKMKSSYSTVGPLSKTVFTTLCMICKMPILDFRKKCLK